MSATFWNDVRDALEEQGWKARPKDGGLVVSPPPGKARTGFAAVFIHDPKSDSHAMKVVRSRLRQAGLILESEKQEIVVVKANGSNGHSHPAIAEHAHVSPFVRARQRISDAINALSALEEALDDIERESAEVQKAREALRTLGLSK